MAVGPVCSPPPCSDSSFDWEQVFELGPTMIRVRAEREERERKRLVVSFKGKVVVRLVRYNRATGSSL